MYVILDWVDIIEFDFNNPEFMKYMTETMAYWVQTTGINGYCSDVAGFIPVDFWNDVRMKLDKIKPIFLLAEWELRDLHKKAFDMTCA
jgi:glycosidase